jgi:uncharacterized protein (DUF488 family)
MRIIITVGVYGFDAPRFLEALAIAKVSQLIDVRQRRGVRGSEYAWANAQRLQGHLRDAGIAYRHLRSLAPTTELRQLQYAADARTGVGKRSRRHLDAEYVTRYRRDIVREESLVELVDGLPTSGRAALLCVESDPEACHRALIAEELQARFGVAVVHVRP